MSARFILTPRNGEDFLAFMSRFMADDAMRSAFPSDVQRLLMGLAQWRDGRVVSKQIQIRRAF